MRKRPRHFGLRTTELLAAMLEDTAKHLGTTRTDVLEKGLILARRHYQRYGSLNLDFGARNADNVL